MAWMLFAWTVIPTGLTLTALLASGQKIAIEIASFVLKTPVRCGNVTLSLATVVTAVCLITSSLAYSAVRRDEFQMLAAVGQPTALIDQYLRNKYYHERNIWISLFGLALWAIAWRLKQLAGRRQLVPVPRLPRRRPFVSRACWALLGALFLAAADIPLCRLNYNLQLSIQVTPKKEKLIAAAGPCEGAMLSATASGECAVLCHEARQLSEERLACIQWARDWHFLGRIGAELFDDSRGVTQGQERIDKLFAAKTCVQVIRSVDKSNLMVNAFCAGTTLVSVIGFVVALTNVLDGDFGGDTPTPKND